jgi:hypothetical protein
VVSVPEAAAAEPEPVVAEPTVIDAPKVVGVTDWRPLDTNDAPAVDPIEMALADLVDQADESILSFADAMLSDHPTWVRLRQMQDDCFQLLCDYRLTKTLEQS